MISQIHHKWCYLYNVCKTQAFFYSAWEAFPGKSCCWQMDSKYQDQTGYSTCFEVTLCRHSESFVWVLVVKCLLSFFHATQLSQIRELFLMRDLKNAMLFFSMQAASGLIQLKSNCPCIVLTLCMREFKSLLTFSSVGLEPILETS